MSMHDEWILLSDGKPAPAEPGWYGTTHCWDQEEGSFPGAHYWNGEEWDERLPFMERSIRRFETEEEAMAWVKQNDISF